MRIDERPGMNPPLQTDWNTEYHTVDDYELDTDGTPIYVKTVAPDPYTQPNYLRIQAEITDDGARLDTYQARRLRTIDDARNDIEEALKKANKGRDGADSVSRLDRVVTILDEAITTLGEALDMLETSEGR